MHAASQAEVQAENVSCMPIRYRVAATVRVARTLARPPPAATSASGIICGSPAVAVAAPGTEEEGAKAGDQAAEVRRHHYVRHVRHRSTIRCKVSFKYYLSFWSSFSASGDDLKKKIGFSLFCMLCFLQFLQSSCNTTTHWTGRRRPSPPLPA